MRAPQKPLKPTRARASASGVGKILQTFFMDPLGITAYRVAKDIGITPIAMSHILRGRRAITPSIALRLGSYFGIEPDFWLSLQAHQDLQTEAQNKNRLQPTRCEALGERAFVIKESKQGVTRNWQVIIVKTRASGAGRKG
jgi:addiction module HigA family antidote